MSKYLPSIVLLSIIIFPSLFAYIFFELERNHCRNDFSKIINIIPDKSIQTITFPDKSMIEWEEVNREFLLNGQLYDVISIQTINSTTTIKCISDTIENKILVSYYNSLGNSEKNTNENNLVVKFQDLIYLITETPLLRFNTLAINKEFITNDITLLNKYRKIISPPPNNYLFSNISA